MEYEISLPEKAVELLTLIPNPTDKEVQKRRGDFIDRDVGIVFRDLSEQIGLAESTIRTRARKELYGLVGIFYERFIGGYSNRATGVRMDSEEADEVIDEIFARGHEVRYFVTTGEIVDSKMKRIYRQKGFFIPESVGSEVSAVFDKEKRIFEGEFNEAYIGVLRYIFDRSKELREKYGANWYPQFTATEISRVLGIDEEDSLEAMKDLNGLLCECRIMESRKVWWNKFFLPSSRYDLVLRMI